MWNEFTLVEEWVHSGDGMSSPHDMGIEFSTYGSSSEVMLRYSGTLLFRPPTPILSIEKFWLTPSYGVCVKTSHQRDLLRWRNKITMISPVSISWAGEERAALSIAKIARVSRTRFSERRVGPMATIFLRRDMNIVRRAFKRTVRYPYNRHRAGPSLFEMNQ